MKLNGKVFKGIGGFYYVKTGQELLECKAIGRFRKEKVTPMVGDNVEVEPTGPGRGIIRAICPRANLFVRPPVSNLDLLFIVVSAAPPVTDLYLSDYMAGIALAKDIKPILVINKADLDPGDDIVNHYAGSGIRIIRTSAVSGEGNSALLEAIRGKVAAFSGNSGVGKSSLLNRMDTALELKTGQLTDRIQRGKHTTRHVELFELENGGILADTPGFSSFEGDVPEILQKERLQFVFPEFSPYIEQCRFVGCAHNRDKDCAVRAAAEQGLISMGRYKSYLRMYEHASTVHAWELKD